MSTHPMQLKTKYLVTLAVVLCILFLGGLAWLATRGLHVQLSSAPSVVKFYRIADSLDTNRISVPMMTCFQEALSVLDIPVAASAYAHANFVMFETLNLIDHNISRVSIPKSTFAVYGIGGSDLMAGKHNLALMMRKCQAHATILPPSYIPLAEDDIQRLIASHHPGKVYIMKKNVQRQQGHLLTNRLDDVLEKRHDYVVVQDVLQDPLIINKHKINIRIYMLIIIRPGTKSPEFYIYRDGFMYYTPKAFVPFSTIPDEVITTGYIDRSIYEHNPLTLQDLFAHVGELNATTLWQSIIRVFQSIKHCYTDTLVKQNAGIPGTKFLVYGCDIAPDSRYACTLMEINKGPDLGYKDERDKHVKLGMVCEMLQRVGFATGRDRDMPEMFAAV